MLYKKWKEHRRFPSNYCESFQNKSVKTVEYVQWMSMRDQSWSTHLQMPTIKYNKTCNRRWIAPERNHITVLTALSLFKWSRLNSTASLVRLSVRAKVMVCLKAHLIASLSITIVIMSLTTLSKNTLQILWKAVHS